MNELLKELYIHFYEKRPVPQLKDEIEQCHQELIEKLDKPERTAKTKLLKNYPSTVSAPVFIWRGNWVWNYAYMKKSILLQRAISLNRQHN